MQAPVAVLPKVDTLPTKLEMEKVITKLQSRDKYEIFKEPVTEEMVRFFRQLAHCVSAGCENQRLVEACVLLLVPLFCF